MVETVRFYDLQILSIIQTGFPASNDPPLVYYLLTPFVLLSESSFIGIKIGMALMGSIMVFPAYFLTEIFIKRLNVESKVPALLSAFLITINPFYFQMIGDFMQNLVGVLFLLLLLYFTVKWFEDTKEWKKYGILTVILLICGIFTHIYTGILAVVLFIALILFNLIFRTYKTGKTPSFDLKIVGIAGIFIIGGLAVLFVLYPVMFSKFSTVLSFLNNSASDSSNTLGGPTTSPIIFLTIPFILGILATINVLYKGFKEKISIQNDKINKKTLLALVYLVMIAVLIFLSTLPSIDSQYQSRFMMLTFVPIALMVPLGLKLIENWLFKKNSSRNGLNIGIISIIAIIFAMSAFYTASSEFSSLGPSISEQQYNDLVNIKANYLQDKIDPNGIIVVNEYHTGYWAQYMLGMQVETGNTNEIQEKYPNRTIYMLTLSENKQSGLNGMNGYSWNPLLPYSFPFGGFNVMNSSNGHS
ncbi:MAG: glycosyltransferase family 39 protein, partial [Methanobacterium sp.]